jgi:anti-sigma B factor antagonist
MEQVEESGAHATIDRTLDDTGVPLVTISGEIDMSNIATIEGAFEALIAEAPPRIVFDLSALEFIDSSGIALLLRVAEHVERLELRRPSGTVQRIIEVTGLSNILHVQP